MAGNILDMCQQCSLLVTKVNNTQDFISKNTYKEWR